MATRGKYPYEVRGKYCSKCREETTQRRGTIRRGTHHGSSSPAFRCTRCGTINR